MSDINATIAVPLTMDGTLQSYSIAAGIGIIPSLSATLTHSVIDAELSIPLSLSAVAELKYEIAGAISLTPSFSATVEAYPVVTGVLVQDMPMQEIEAYWYTSIFASLIKDLPMQELTSASLVDALATADVYVPAFVIATTGVIGEVADASLTFPMMTLSATMLRGAVGTFAGTVPAMTISTAVIVDAIGDADLTVPALTLSGMLSVAEYLTMVMNLRNQALTEFTNYDFDTMCHFKGKNLGATATGIYDLDTGETDGTAEIEWNFRTGLLDLHMKTKKKLRQAWLSCKINGDLTVTVVEADGTEYEYDAKSYEVTEDGVRVKFGKGLRDRYMAIDVKNEGRGTITLDSIRINLDRGSGLR